LRKRHTSVETSRTAPEDFHPIAQDHRRANLIRVSPSSRGRPRYGRGDKQPPIRSGRFAGGCTGIESVSGRINTRDRDYISSAPKVAWGRPRWRYPPRIIWSGRRWYYSATNLFSRASDHDSHASLPSQINSTRFRDARSSAAEDCLLRKTSEKSAASLAPFSGSINAKKNENARRCTVRSSLRPMPPAANHR
jgi:hypothetical protein